MAELDFLAISTAIANVYKGVAGMTNALPYHPSAIGDTPPVAIVHPPKGQLYAGMFEITEWTQLVTVYFERVDDEDAVIQSTLPIVPLVFAAWRPAAAHELTAVGVGIVQYCVIEQFDADKYYKVAGTLYAAVDFTHKIRAAAGHQYGL